MLLKQSTARNRMVFMTDEADHVSGATGLTLTITASKDGAAFASITPTVTERGNGWYSLALTTSHTDTLGDLALHITATGADPTDLRDQVVVLLPGETAPADVVEINGSAAAAQNLERSAVSMHRGSVTGAATSTTLVDSGLTQADNDHWKGRILIFTTGALAKQATDITAFNAATDTLTFSPLTAAPSGGDEYAIV
jgi:hypothetical protein